MKSVMGNKRNSHKTNKRFIVISNIIKNEL